MDDLTSPVADEPPAELIVPLRKPVTLGSQVYAEIRLREPTAAEWKQWDKLSGVEADTTAIAVVSGVPLPAVEMIGARDLIIGARYLARFLD